jgi:hypothetical protein
MTFCQTAGHALYSRPRAAPGKQRPMEPGRARRVILGNNNSYVTCVDWSRRGLWGPIDEHLHIRLFPVGYWLWPGDGAPAAPGSPAAAGPRPS